MLDELFVKNLGLIGSARIEPGAGLVAVTGETGAGKTLLLGALRLLRGDTAHSDRIGPEGDEARVEGRFRFGSDEMVVARRLSPARSRAYVDGSMMSATAVAERFAGRLEIVAQHEHMALTRESAVRMLVDAALDPVGMQCRSAYSEAWKAFQELAKELTDLGDDPRSVARELDLAVHQAREIAEAGFQPGDDATLLATLQRLRNAGSTSEALTRAHGLLADDRNAGDLIREALTALREAAELDPAMAAMSLRLDGLITELDDLAVAIRDEASTLEHEPSVLAAAEERAAVLADLRRKYGETLEEVISFGKEAEARVDPLTSRLERFDEIGPAVEAARQAVLAAGAELGDARRHAAKRISEVATAHLRDLGFTDPAIEITLTETEPGAEGTDKISLQFASDASLPLGAVSRIASGGELSRLVLAVRLATGAADVPIVAFDEVDAGIGGATALAMGEKLARLSRDRQVFVVTHLPQVAAFADIHFVVHREGPVASVVSVDGEERLAELTRMLGGLPESERGREHAAELLALGDAAR